MPGRSSRTAGVLHLRLDTSQFRGRRVQLPADRCTAIRTCSGKTYAAPIRWTLRSKRWWWCRSRCIHRSRRQTARGDRLGRRSSASSGRYVTASVQACDAADAESKTPLCSRCGFLLGSAAPWSCTSVFFGSRSPVAADRNGVRSSAVTLVIDPCCWRCANQIRRNCDCSRKQNRPRSEHSTRGSLNSIRPKNCCESSPRPSSSRLRKNAARKGLGRTTGRLQQPGWRAA